MPLSFFPRLHLLNAWWRPALAIPAALACGLAVAAPASATTTPAVEVCGQGPAMVRPTSMILTCADNGEQAKSLHWTSWTATEATATGTVTWRACTAMCADSRKWASTTADYTLAGPKQVAGEGVLFTRLELHVTGATPHGFLRNLAFDEAPSTGPAPHLTQAGRTSRPAAASGSLGYAQIEGYWRYAGGPDSSAGSYDDAQVAAAITGAESSFLPGIIQPGVDYCGAGADRAGWGLWQITCGNSVPSKYGSDFQLLDPWNNAEGAVYKCKQDMSAGVGCFAPWSTYTSGAYEQYLQHTNADMSISDPGEYVQVNSTPPGTPSSPRPDPGSTYGPPMPSRSGGGGGGVSATSPAVYNPASGHLEVYGTGTNNELEESYYTGSNWTPWQSPVPSVKITGVPAAVYDPITKNLEVYATGTDAKLQEIYWIAGDGWHHADLKGSITASPSAVYDQASNNLEVYATGKGGTLNEIYYNGSQWSQWQTQKGPITNSPSAVYDPLDNTLEVYAASTSHTLQEYYWNSSWHHADLKGSINSSPSAVYDPVTKNLEVYMTATNGKLAEQYWNPTATWKTATLGGAITDSPSAVYDQASNNLEVYARGLGGTLNEIYYNGSQWSQWQITHATITGAPHAVYDTSTGNLEVYALTNGHTVWEHYWTPSTGTWHNANLHGNLSAL